jgi:hypothetical protein
LPLHSARLPARAVAADVLDGLRRDRFEIRIVARELPRGALADGT